ncbi:hypothetical protein A2U14_00960 [Fusobacterium necrophorum subsp. funduliforme]|uniref:hypothetical protein n=1 Tax=Fusobacterium necrophorum TaxID=859 RepID=UPI000787C9C4|nr:hypothetical protein [Fusobacterium necrophorum]KYM43539.1 hypothetical protein A2U05_04390 [Fusobacterium necrophorum subsp. funduliforme]KYM61920.1 hypothetical protein A2U14_00960 [Fusobacterium necrophorum subsp. funduliforme]MDK4486773.1 phage tail tape measure protein [Fusobacterium necrophorum]MDK4488615.1 phage tail tape measure protein [Fusobacterium necrophorum]MDK4505144.1 phage tail tape measure protein [Fusobacterium necrophorum]
MAKKQLQTVIEMQDKFSKQLELFSEDLHKATDELKNFAKENEKSSGSSGKLTDSLLNLSNVAKTAGIAYLGKKIFELGNFAVGAASKMDELGNVTSQVFGNSKREIEDWAKTMDDKIGRSIYQLQNFASIYGSMFKGAGFDTSYFKNISKDLAVFTADFSSFFNVTDDEAFTAIKGALTGETEALKRFGIILNDTVMAEYALTQGIKANWSELDTALKMQLRYNKLMEITTHIQDDAERTVDGYANSLKKAEGLIDNIATSVGQKLIPGATRAVHMFNGIAEAIDNMLSKKDVTDYVFDFVTEKQSIDELKERYIELSELYLQGLNTPESEKERLELYNQILTLYPELFGKIDSEAEHYLQLAGALDTVISKLKEKTLAQFQSDRIAEHSRSLEKHATQIAKYEMESDEEIARIASKNGGFNPNTKFGKAQYQAIHDLHEESAKGDEKAAEKLAQRLRGLTSAERAATIEFARHEVIRNQKIEGYIGDIQKLNDEFNKTMKYQTAQLETVLNVSSETSYAKARHYSKYAQELDVERGKIPKTAVKDEASEKAAKEIEELKTKWDTLASKDLKGKKEIYQRLMALGEKNLSKYANEINALEKELEKKPKKEKASREERYTYQNYRKDLQNQQIFADITGIKELEQLKSKLSTIQSYMKGAIEKGNKGLLEKLQQDFKETTFEIHKVNIQKGLDEIQKQLDTLDIKLESGKMDEQGYHKERVSLLDKVLEQFSENFMNLSDQDKAELKEKIEAFKKEKTVSDEAIKQKEKETAAAKRVTEGLDLLSSGFNGIAAGISAANINNSQTMNSISGIFSSFGTVAKGLETLGGFKSLGSIATTAASWGSSLATVGTIASGVGAAIGVVGAIGSFIGRKGKKKAAKIDAENKENEEAYKKQISALQQLTQAIEKYSERIKTFADRVLVDISKNPTLKYIAGGQRNFDLMHDSMISGKHFADIAAIEKGSASYRKHFRKKRKSTYTKVDISEAELLKYLGFDKTELDAFTDAEMKQLDKVLDKVNHETLRRATGRNLTESSIEEWKKQVHEFTKQLEFLEKEKTDLFRGSTLESFSGMEFRTEKELIKEYTEQFKELGLEGEKYTETIKEMAKNNQVLVTSMLDVRNNAIEGLATGNGGFLTAAKSYFEKIYKNASSVAYDVAFSDIDSYMSEMFKTISDKLLDVKKSGKLDFSNLLSDFDFAKFKNLELSEKEIKKSLDTIKRQLLDSGVDLSIINKLLPQSDFNNRLNDLTTSLSAAMSAGLETHKYESFTETLGKSLYDSTKNGLVKAFSESALYRGMIENFIDTEDLRSKLEKAGNFKEAFNLTENIMKKFGYEMEANGFGGFDAIGNLAKEEKKLGNAYYQDKASNMEINVTNHFHDIVYGVQDLESKINKAVTDGLELASKKPVILGG